MAVSGRMQLNHPSDSKQLEDEIGEYFRSGDDDLRNKERYAKRIIMTLRGIQHSLGYSGEIEVFGSFSNGFMTFSSDLNLVLRVDRDDAHLALARLASKDAGLSENGFENVTQVFSGNVPLLKFTDMKRKVEVDLCINNELGLRNSALLKAYCNWDPRVQKLGRLVKDWAKGHGLVSPADGCLNSYAYTLLVIHYLQGLDPPIVENLQEKARSLPPRNVVDRKWGYEKQWDTRFWEKPPEPEERSQNRMTVGELLLGFFDYFGNSHSGFDWQTNAVCIRLHNAKQCRHVDKFSLDTPCCSDQWYVEDPFDLRHNLAGVCTDGARRRILDAMAEASRTLRSGQGWYAIQPEGLKRKFFLKCHLSAGARPAEVLKAFHGFGLEAMYYPDSMADAPLPGQAYLRFGTAEDRRRAHERSTGTNKSSVADCHLSTYHSLRDANAKGTSYKLFTMDSLWSQHELRYTEAEFLTEDKVATHAPLTLAPQQQPPVQEAGSKVMMCIPVMLRPNSWTLDDQTLKTLEDFAEEPDKSCATPTKNIMQMTIKPHIMMPPISCELESQGIDWAVIESCALGNDTVPRAT